VSYSASSVSSRLESHEVEASPDSPGRLNKVGGYPVRIKIINPDHSALVGIGSNSGGLESAWVSTSSLAAEQGHRLADRHTHMERKRKCSLIVESARWPRP